MIVKRILLIVVLLIVFISGLLLMLYEMKFNNGDYDILLTNRITHHLSYGIQYKKHFEIWQFSENVHSGIAEYRVLPF